MRFILIIMISVFMSSCAPLIILTADALGDTPVGTVKKANRVYRGVNLTEFGLSFKWPEIFFERGDFEKFTLHKETRTIGLQKKKVSTINTALYSRYGGYALGWRGYCSVSLYIMEDVDSNELCKAIPRLQNRFKLNSIIDFNIDDHVMSRMYIVRLEKINGYAVFGSGLLGPS